MERGALDPRLPMLNAVIMIAQIDENVNNINFQATALLNLF